MNARKNGRDNGCVIVITCYNYYYFDYYSIVCAQKGRSRVYIIQWFG